MAKIYIGSQPFAREGEGMPQPVSQTTSKKVFIGKLSEGVPTSVLPKGVRDELALGKPAALTDFLKSTEA